MKKSTPAPQDRVVFPPLLDMTTLTIRDLLAVRDRYHAALSNMPNVIATAIGRYRFRDGDSPELISRKPDEPRTLLNSKVGKYSWPAVLVFVSKWIAVDDPCNPWEVIPQYLYLEDGRLAPTCVIKIAFDQHANFISDSDRISFPENHYGGGIGLYTEVQGEEHMGTAACLVTDGERHYVLTARHVCGPEGQTVLTRVRGEPVRIGESDPVQARMMRFSDLYPGYPGDHALTNVDAGLVRLDDMANWTSQVLEIGELTEPANFAPHNLSLEIIGKPVRAFGAISGNNMHAEIAGLFPRYRTIGGADYLADVMIVGRQDRKGRFRVQRGDSGALWVLDGQKVDGRSIPVALNWGAMALVDTDREYQIAFATFVSSICKRLQIELVTGHNTGLHPVWGKQNHRNIAEIATDIARAHKSPACKLIAGHKARMAELAFLPDLWKMWNKRSKKVEGPNHYAAVDLKHGNKLLGNLGADAKAWLNFYKAYNKTAAEKVNEGALPFRIGDVFDGLVAFRKAGNLKKFLGGAGILAHYVADACNPAHISRFGRGDPDDIDQSYHSIWDNWRKDSPAAEAVVKRLKNAHIRDNIKTGKAATKKVIALMKRTRKHVDVGDYVVPGKAALSRKQARAFCRSDLGEQAWVNCVADGCSVLLALLESAWKVGAVNGPAVSDSAIKKVKIGDSDIQHFLNEDGYLQSRNLRMIAGA